jgi:hypothetical protein
MSYVICVYGTYVPPSPKKTLIRGGDVRKARYMKNIQPYRCGVQTAHAVGKRPNKCTVICVCVCTCFALANHTDRQTTNRCKEAHLARLVFRLQLSFLETQQDLLPSPR